MSTDIHGADIYTASEKAGIGKDNILDFSSNINPLGIPDSVKDAAINSIGQSSRYPDINSRELKKSISVFENIPENWIFPSNGAAEAIFRITFFLRPSRGLVTAPAFSEYENAMVAAGADVDYYCLKEENDFKIQDDLFNKIQEGIDIIFLCNPNNPTGQLIERATMEKIICACKEKGIFVVIDECFLDFSAHKELYSMTGLLHKYDNLIILKAFTKIYAIPGMRLGYCMSSNERVIEGLNVCGPPWNVSSIAQAAGTAALSEVGYVEKTVEYVSAQRRYLFDELNAIGVKTYSSNANYILFSITDTFGDIDLKEELLKRGILIRSCSNYKGLDSSYYRIAVKTYEENKLLIMELREIAGIK